MVSKFDTLTRKNMKEAAGVLDICNDLQHFG